jgi:hypothetical protein
MPSTIKTGIIDAKSAQTAYNYFPQIQHLSTPENAVDIPLIAAVLLTRKGDPEIYLKG